MDARVKPEHDGGWERVGRVSDALRAAFPEERPVTLRHSDLWAFGKAFIQIHMLDYFNSSRINR